MKNLILLIFAILALSGCEAIIATAVVGYSIFSPCPEFRNNPGSWNMWGPTEGKSYEEYQKEYQLRKEAEKQNPS